MATPIDTETHGKRQSGAHRAHGGPMVLRVGLVIGSKVKERVIRDRETVTIGQSEKNTMAVAARELPKSWPLFQLIDGRYYLYLSEQMDGRLNEGNHVHTVAQLRAQGRFKKTGNAWTMPLAESMRGKVMIGDVTVLFMFVPAPATTRHAPVPLSVRSTIGDRVDPWMASVLGISLLFHVGVFVFFKWIRDDCKSKANMCTDRCLKKHPETFKACQSPIPPGLQDYDVAVNTEVVLPPKPEVTEVAATETTEEAASETATEAASEPAETPHKKAEPSGGGGGGESSDEIRHKVSRAAPLRIAGRLGGNGRIFDTGGGVDDRDDLAADIEQARKSGTTVTGATEPGGGGGGMRNANATTTTIASGTTEKAGTVSAKDTGDPKRTKKVDTGPVGGGKTEHASGDSSGSLDPEIVSRTIKSRYWPGALKCFQDALKDDPTLKGGKATVQFTVGVAGNVIAVSVDGMEDGGVAACIKKKARGWRFQQKPEENADFEISFVFRK